MIVDRGHRLVAEEDSIVVDHRILLRTVAVGTLVEGNLVDRRQSIGRIVLVAVVVADLVVPVAVELEVQKVVDHLV